MISWAVQTDAPLCRRRHPLSSGLCLVHFPFPFPFLNAAETDVAAFRLTVHMRLDPEQPPPLQPAKVEPLLFGIAVSVTTVPLGYTWEQSERQVIPDGAPATVPGPDFATGSGVDRARGG